MRLCKISAFISSLVFVPLLWAATQNGTAQVVAFADPTITEDAIVDFGLISPSIGSSCTMDNSGTITSGGCLGSPAAGQFTVSSLEASTNVLITVTGGTDGNVTFSSLTDISDGTTSLTDVADGASSGPFTTTAVPADIVLTVFGTMSVDTTLTAGTTYSVTYTVDVTYQ